ncbi:MAG TPA: GPR1/FUN34/YaaH family transporter [Trebonia sp.]|nr:GPR1/FUN34/YaaH family transporter [Trebonia sp.]
MATDPRYETAHDGPAHRSWEDLAVAEDHAAWLARSRVMLTPIAAPSIMGLFGFTIGTVMLGAFQAGWYGNATTPLIIWPFALFAGGIMQSIAAVASLRARDGVAVAVHTAWGSFWVGWGILQLLVTVHLIPPIPLGAASASFAFWFIALTLITFWGALGALASNVLLFFTLAVLTAASAVTAAGFYAGSLGTVNAGGWLYVISAAAAWLLAGAMTLEHSFGRAIIPVGKWSRTANVPGAKVSDPIGYPAGMPGVKVGQ